MKVSKKKISIAIVILILTFIFVNSMIAGSISLKISELPRDIVQSIIPYGKYKWLDNFLIYHIRTFAHIFEYAILGLIITKFYYFKKRTVQRLVNTFFILIFTGFLDETIQLFSQRQSRISDVWIDFGGAVIGFTIYIVFQIIKGAIKNRSNKYDKN